MHAAAGALLAYIYHTHRRPTRAAVRERLEQIMSARYRLPRGTLASETDDERLMVPAVIGRTKRILLGDLGTVEQLLEASGPACARKHLREHPVSAVLVCMGSEAAAAVSGEFRKKQIAYMGLEGCVDHEGYPLIDLHLKASKAFINSQLDAASNSGGCILVHCHEGKNRSAALCVSSQHAPCSSNGEPIKLSALNELVSQVAYLMVEERMPLTSAVAHVWQQRPIVLDNQSFVDQLVDLAEREGLLS